MCATRKLARWSAIASIAVACLVVSGLAAAQDRIGYSSMRPAGWNIYLLQTGRPPRRLTDGPALDYDAVFSPDGRFVVFTSERNGTPQLFVLNVERGGDPRLLVRSDGLEDQATISPDGRTVVFVSDREGKADLYSIPFKPTRTTDIRSARRLTSDPGADLRPTFSPDGRTIVFTSTRDSVDRGHPIFPFAIQSFGNLFRAGPRERTSHSSHEFRGVGWVSRILGGWAVHLFLLRAAPTPLPAIVCHERGWHGSASRWSGAPRDQAGTFAGWSGGL